MASMTTPEPLRTTGRLFSYSQAAGITGIREQTLRKWASQKKLTTIKLGRAVRIPESALHDLIAEGFRQGSNL